MYMYMYMYMYMNMYIYIYIYIARVTAYAQSITFCVRRFGRTDLYTSTNEKVPYRSVIPCRHFAACGAP